SAFAPRILLTTINRQGVVFLWPIRLPGSDGRVDAWSKSALEAAEMATRTWIRIQANLSLGAYSVDYTDHLPDPEWSDLPFRAPTRPRSLRRSGAWTAACWPFPGRGRHGGAWACGRATRAPGEPPPWPR